jgi:hypothetical protein
MQGFRMQDRCGRHFILHPGSWILYQASETGIDHRLKYPASSIEHRSLDDTRASPARGEVIADIVWAVNRPPRNTARHRNGLLWERLPAANGSPQRDDGHTCEIMVSCRRKPYFLNAWMPASAGMTHEDILIRRTSFGCS